MKPSTVSKKQLANAMGISLPTLRAWLQPFKDELSKLGVKPTDKILKPPAAKYICERLELNLEEIGSDSYLKESERK